MNQNKSLKLFANIFKKLDAKWPDFIEALKRVADKDDRNQIFLNDFVTVCKQFRVDLTEEERKNLLNAFPGRAEGKRERVNIY